MHQNYCVIGDPIGHSLSPAIYNELFSLYAMKDARYTAVQVAPADLASFIQSLGRRGMQGFNVTMPLKGDVMHYLSYKDPAARYGVNTVVCTQDGLKGYSTDAEGFRRSLQLHDLDYEGSRVTFLGCGGAAKTLIADCLQHNPARVVVLNRTTSRCQAFQGNPCVTVAPLETADSWMPDTDILVNATPLGMQGIGEDFLSLSFVTKLPSTAFVADLIYRPAQTKLLAAAAQCGLGNMNGLWMLLWQAFFAFELYTGILPDMNAFSRLYDKLTEAPS